MNNSNINNLDLDPQETQEWIDSFKDLIELFIIFTVCEIFVYNLQF